MNLTQTTPPRLACRAVRQWSALVENQPTRHLARCPDCREYFQAVEALDSELRVEAARSARDAVVPSTGFEQRLLRSIRAETVRPASRHAREWPLGRTFAGVAAAAAAAVVAIIVVREPAEPAGRTATTEPGVPAEAVAIVNAVDSLSDQLVTTVIPSAGELVARNPLQQELGLMYADAQSALDFLALNFLPRPVAHAGPNNPSERTRSML